jgi:hypothetical protein
MIGWEERFNQLVSNEVFSVYAIWSATCISLFHLDLLQAEFGRLNGHFSVPNPEEIDNNAEHEQYDTSTEATRFYKWVNSRHDEYESFRSGAGSKVLNDERVVQLLKLGFQFDSRGGYELLERY